LLVSDKYGGVYGDNAGEALADRKQVGHFFPGQPAVFINKLTLEHRQHSITAAKCKRPDIRK
jgi:hypothetical protein